MTPVRDPAKFPTLTFEKNLWKAGFTSIAGIDEAGRGAWAGPVYAAAVILPPDPDLAHGLDGVRDSKLMTPLERQAWAPCIQLIALAWGIGLATSQEIDVLGILPATKLAALRALASLSTPPSSYHQYSIPNPQSKISNPQSLIPDALLPGRLLPDYLITDYLIFPSLELPQTALIKGDRLSLTVSAASVLAKTARDARMRELDDMYPGYGFARHKGYGTRLHREAIGQIGLCEIHRKSFCIPH
jgi:ribonuclease HII